MNENVERWLHFAREDLMAAKAVLKDNIYNQVCFHAQQCVEKALKAIIVKTDSASPKVHAVTDLLSQIPNDCFPALRDNIIDLDDYYIPTRYPDALPGTLPDGLPGESEATDALALAERVLAETEQYLVK